MLVSYRMKLRKQSLRNEGKPGVNCTNPDIRSPRPRRMGATGKEKKKIISNNV